MAKSKITLEDELQDVKISDEASVQNLTDENAEGTNTGDEETDEKIKASRIAKEVKTSLGAKNVKIQVVEPVDCIIAGVPYKLNKDKSYEVPSDVAAVLNNAKKAYRI